jgi:hypothetical protein
MRATLTLTYSSYDRNDDVDLFIEEVRGAMQNAQRAEGTTIDAIEFTMKTNEETTGYDLDDDSDVL